MTEDVASLAHRLSAPHGEDRSRAVEDLAFKLAHAVAPEDGVLVEQLSLTEAVRHVISIAREQSTDIKLLHCALGALVNLACIGGGHLVKRQGGLELMLDMLRSSQPAVQYFAAAGVQNMVNDIECLQRVVDTDSDVILEELLDSPNMEIRRFAAGALANVSRVAKALPPPKPPPPPSLRTMVGKLARRSSAAPSLEEQRTRLAELAARGEAIGERVAAALAERLLADHRRKKEQGQMAARIQGRFRALLARSRARLSAAAVVANVLLDAVTQDEAVAVAVDVAAEAAAEMSMEAGVVETSVEMCVVAASSEARVASGLETAVEGGVEKKRGGGGGGGGGGGRRWRRRRQ